MAEARQDVHQVWEEDKKPLLEWLAVERLTLDFQGDPPGHHTVTDCGYSQTSKANSASECSQAPAMTVCPAAPLTGSLAHFWPVPNNICVNCSREPSGSSYAPGTVPSRCPAYSHLAWEARRGHQHNARHSEPVGCRTWEHSQPHQMCRSSCGFLIWVCSQIPRITQQLLLAPTFSHLWGLRVRSIRANLCINIALQLAGFALCNVLASWPTVWNAG